MGAHSAAVPDAGDGPYCVSVPSSRLVAPLVIACAGGLKTGRPREQAKAIARIDVKDVHFGWWALASAAAFFPSALLAIAFDAGLQSAADWSSPSALGTFLMLGPWALAAWFLVRAIATSGNGQVGFLDDVGVVGVLALTAAYAVIAT